MSESMKTLKQKVRGVIVARDTVERMVESRAYKNSFGRKYVNEMAIEVMNLAKKVHPLMPYYLVTRKF